MKRIETTLLPVLLLCSGLVGACGGLFQSTDDLRLEVPYRPQVQFNYCVPASISMWRLYDGLPEISQGQIFSQIGGAPCSPADAVYGVSRFTISGSDAYLDLAYGPSELSRDQMIARQITSIDNGIPVMPIVYPSKNHVGIINGGKYSDQGTYLQWEFVYFHNPDPAFGPNYYYTAGEWLSEFCLPGSGYCGQIISSGGTSGWNSHFSNYQDGLAVYGGGGGCEPQNCSAIEY